MATKTKLEITSFSKGLITEASPLTFPDDASLIDENMILNKDGSRQRRLGLGYENPNTIRNITTDVVGGNAPQMSTHVWKNPTKTGEYDIVVVQTSNKLRFFKADGVSISTNELNGGAAANLPADYDVEFKISTASLLGNLIVTYGKRSVLVFSYDASTQLVSYEIVYLTIRDLFGIESPYAVNVAPTVPLPITAADTDAIKHMYNLRNQGMPPVVKTSENSDGTGTPGQFDPARLDRSVGTQILAADTIVWWRYKTSTVGDVENMGLYSIWEVYKDLVATSGKTSITSPAPKGSAILDLFNRSASRQAFMDGLYLADPALILPTDTSIGGVTHVSAFAGRLFYTVKEISLTGGDKNSPKLNNMIFFTQVVKSAKEVGNCYSLNDPTAEENYDPLATDGGFITIPEVGQILKLAPMGSSLFVFATNGVWEIFGGEGGFSALNQNVVKTTTIGAISDTSVVAAEAMLTYWANSGIQLISIDQSSGRGVAVNMTINTIQSLYDSIPDSEKVKVVGIFDEVNRKLRWLYNATELTWPPVFKRELIFDADLKAFYTHRFGPLLSNTRGPVGVVAIPQIRYLIGYTEAGIPLLPLNYTFGWYRDTSFYDLTDYDAPAVLLTGYLTGQAASLGKQVKALVTHLKRTETGFKDGGGGSIVFQNPSGCIVTPQWEWTNSANAGKWGQPMQMYRLQRPYYPTGVAAPFDYSYTVITSKSGLRGRGRALSLKFESEPGKDMHILGWGLEVQVDEEM